LDLLWVTEEGVEDVGVFGSNKCVGTLGIPKLIPPTVLWLVKSDAAGVCLDPGVPHSEVAQSHLMDDFWSNRRGIRRRDEVDEVPAVAITEDWGGREGEYDER